MIRTSKLQARLMWTENRPNYMIAAKIGVAPSRLSEYASGKRPIPAHHLLAMCEVMRCSPDDILGPADDCIDSIS